MPTESTNRTRILIVDDDQLVSQTIELILTAQGYQVETAFDGPETLGILEQRSFDLVIIDYMMPVMTGDRLAIAIKARNPAQRVMMITAYEEALRSSNAVVTCIDRLLSKPFSIPELLRNVESLLND